MPGSLLPREGLTIEAAFAPFRLTLFQPLLSGILLLASYRFPILLTEKWPFLKTFEAVLQSYPSKTSLSLLFCIGWLQKINKTLNKLVLNNFTTDKTWDWSKELIVITGGSAGMGALMEKMFAEKNITIVILDIVDPSETLSSRTTLLPNIHFYKLDITSSTSISQVVSQIRTTHGDPTVLINNAGIGTNKTIFTSSEAEIRRVFNVNTISHFMLVKELVPAMAKANHGHVVTMASMASYMVHAQNVDYACSKASALAFHEGLSQELKGRYGAEKVRTTVVHPSWVRTPMISKLLKKRNFTDFVLEPETVAEAVVKQVLSGYGAQLILPARLSLMSGVRGFPSWLQESMRNGVNQVLNI